MADTAATQRPDALIDKDDGRNYWSSIDADDNGMLGGYPQVSREDLLGSRAFLAKLGIGLRNGRRRVKRVLEGGAGIGRITRGLLLPIADTVDLIEPIAKFTDALREVPGVGSIHNVGLEEWAPQEGVQYDLVWTQWCVGHLTDEQLVDYLKLCATVLEPKTGLIVIKENLISSGVDEFDDVDSSVTRYVLR
ncbi:Alpha N-terminal protein methyltransferase 1 [Escovopsis weberi]|uniref:Alpha N-terminal protein methyltransferase 1 n=1 Tax=Escovopsis weberi TaxID=150374 RepID=A0A0M8N9P4_ESCWE|nr:Alpha N-terminal protein methyltransferase 1 [Escovopsis weberi]